MNRSSSTEKQLDIENSREKRVRKQKTYDDDYVMYGKFKFK